MRVLRRNQLKACSSSNNSSSSIEDDELCAKAMNNCAQLAAKKQKEVKVINLYNEYIIYVINTFFKITF